MLKRTDLDRNKDPEHLGKHAGNLEMVAGPGDTIRYEAYKRQRKV